MKPNCYGVEENLDNKPKVFHVAGNVVILACLTFISLNYFYSLLSKARQNRRGRRFYFIYQ